MVEPNPFTLKNGLYIYTYAF